MLQRLVGADYQSKQLASTWRAIDRWYQKTCQVKSPGKGVRPIDEQLPAPVLAWDLDHGMDTATGLIDFIDGEQGVAAIGKNLAGFDSEEQRIGFTHGCAMSTTHAKGMPVFPNDVSQERRKYPHYFQWSILAF